MGVPLPWERLLWSGRSSFPFPARERYVLTDFRLVREVGSTLDEVALHDIADVTCQQAGLDGFVGSSTLTVRSGDPTRAPLVLRHVRSGPALAAILELLSGDGAPRLDSAAIESALEWRPSHLFPPFGQALAAVGIVLLAVFGVVVVGLHGSDAPPSYGHDDAIYPDGQKKDREEIVRYMEEVILPWAKATLGPIKGGSDRVTCKTCHGRAPDAVEWRMPAVAALPQPDVKGRGWEVYGGPMDAQMRNAIYGYLAESDKQTKAAYMREVVMPGMARLLHRPPYDFTRPYAYNRSQLAFGCYHCHAVR